MKSKQSDPVVDHLTDHEGVLLEHALNISDAIMDKGEQVARDAKEAYGLALVDVSKAFDDIHEFADEVERRAGRNLSELAAHVGFKSKMVDSMTTHLSSEHYSSEQANSIAIETVHKGGRTDFIHRAISHDVKEDVEDAYHSIRKEYERVRPVKRVERYLEPKVKRAERYVEDDLAPEARHLAKEAEEDTSRFVRRDVIPEAKRLERDFSRGARRAERYVDDDLIPEAKKIGREVERDVSRGARRAERYVEDDLVPEAKKIGREVERDLSRVERSAIKFIRDIGNARGDPYHDNFRMVQGFYEAR